ncbi:hypothetical protein MPTK2_1g11320 [Marchantia polymorpha subsp. ruderalis]
MSDGRPAAAAPAACADWDCCIKYRPRTSSGTQVLKRTEKVLLTSAHAKVALLLWALEKSINCLLTRTGTLLHDPSRPTYLLYSTRLDWTGLACTRLPHPLTNSLSLLHSSTIAQIRSYLPLCIRTVCSRPSLTATEWAASNPKHRALATVSFLQLTPRSYKCKPSLITINDESR